ncbi:MAG: cation diffusion facilitator family transporter [Lachnospiraceae bacterium]|nr:cation diffusion facilitator family transporter [Lachnospiraceae bacterium]
MMSLLVKLFVRNYENVSDPRVKKAYAALSGITGIVLNMVLCTAKLVIGFFCHSVAVTADGFNNLSDAGTSLISLLGFKIAGYGGGSMHPFGHGRFEWVMGIFTSAAVFLMGIKLAGTSAAAIANPSRTLFDGTVAAVLLLSVAVKLYMYFYNKRFAEVTGSETLKAAAADCISDSVATAAVFLSAVIGCSTGLAVDGYCGALVSVFIMFNGVKSLWEVLGRIMGKAADQDTVEQILQRVRAHREIAGVQDLMLHDYGFGYFAVSMRAEGYRKDSGKLSAAVSDIAYELYRQFRCDCCIQIDYLLKDKALEKTLTEKIYDAAGRYSEDIQICQFRLLEDGEHITAAFELLYPTGQKKHEAELCRDITQSIEAEDPRYRVMIKSVIRRPHFRFRADF